MNGDPENLKRKPEPVLPDDAGSQALAEALRSSFGLIKFVMVGLVLVFLASGFFQVGLQEKAIKLRFGKPVGEGDKALLGAGLHWSFPYPIDEVRKVPITEIQRVSSSTGWYATTPEQELANTEPPPRPSLSPGVDGYVLTGDGNIVHVRALLYYRVQDPISFLFDFVNATNAIRDALDDAILAAAARFRVDDILTRDREGFQEAVRKRVTQLVEARQLGIVVDQCSLDSKAPRWLAEPFNRVLQAEVTRSKVLNEARNYENQVLSKASADAASLLNSAESERARLVQDIQSDAERFKDLLPKFKASPDLFVQLRLTEVISKVMTNAQDKWFVPDRADGRPRELRLLLNREPQKPKTEGTP